jgi:hypothetical protein
LLTKVGYLVVSYNESEVLAFNYAIGGSRVQTVESQIKDAFLPHAGKKPDWTPWAAKDSLFSMSSFYYTNSVTWVGVNDIGFGLDPEIQITRLFDAQDLLYDAGARNFIFFNAPPVERSPAGKFLEDSLIPGGGRQSTRDRVNRWNEILAIRVKSFKDSHPDIATEIYDANAFFHKVLDTPSDYELLGGSSWGKATNHIWYDHLHPSTAMQNMIANDFVEFLEHCGT